MPSLWRSFVGIWKSEGYRQYLHRRGYPAPQGWPFVRRAFLECWFEPGFHLFWRLWNPALGFLTFRLYRLLGGNRGGRITKVAAFFISGLLHGLAVLPFLGWSLTIPVTFTCFGLLVVAGQSLSPLLRQNRWPKILNGPVNAGLVLASFDIGFRVDAWLG